MTTEEYVFSAENQQRLRDIWDNAPTKFPVSFDSDQYAEPDDSEATRELSDGEYDRIADAYERRLGL